MEPDIMREYDSILPAYHPLYACKECGSVVLSMDAHNAWHERMVAQPLCESHEWSPNEMVPNIWDPYDKIPQRTCKKCGRVEVNAGFGLQDDWVTRAQFENPVVGDQ